MADVFLTTVTHPGKLWELLTVLVCKSQQLSCGLSGGFWFEEALTILFYLFFFSKAPKKIVLGKVTLLCPGDVSSAGQMPGVLQKIEENCEDSRAEPETTFDLILGIKITDTCYFPVCFG